MYLGLKTSVFWAPFIKGTMMVVVTIIPIVCLWVKKEKKKPETLDTYTYRVPTAASASAGVSGGGSLRVDMVTHHGVVDGVVAM